LLKKRVGQNEDREAITIEVIAEQGLIIKPDLIEQAYTILWTDFSNFSSFVRVTHML
jgi:hypothetical protein